MCDLEPGILARLPSNRVGLRLRADVTVSAFNLCIDAASCGLPEEAGYANRRRRPAGYLEAIRMWVGFVFRGPPGRRGLRSIGGILPPTRCARWGNREPGVLARLPPHRAGSRPRADVTGFRDRGLRIDAASCSSTHEAGCCKSTPASCRLPWGDPDVGRVCDPQRAGPARIVQLRRHPTAYT